MLVPGDSEKREENERKMKLFISQVETNFEEVFCRCLSHIVKFEICTGTAAWQDGCGIVY